MFSLYANDKALQMKTSNLGVKVDDQTVGRVLYVDDQVWLVEENEENLQSMLNTVVEWRWKRRLVVNLDKPQIVHFRRKTVVRSSVVLNFGSVVLSCADQYKYLGLTLGEHMTFKEAVSVLAQSAGRAPDQYWTKLNKVAI